MIFLTNHEFQASENSEVVLKFTQTYEPSFLFTKPFPPLGVDIFTHSQQLGLPQRVCWKRTAPGVEQTNAMNLRWSVVTYGFLKMKDPQVTMAFNKLSIKLSIDLDDLGGTPTF